MATTREINESVYSDLWKDVYGSRPRHDLSNVSDEELSERMRGLSNQIDAEMARELQDAEVYALMHKRGIEDFREAEGVLEYERNRSAYTAPVAGASLADFLKVQP